MRRGISQDSPAVYQLLRRTASFDSACRRRPDATASRRFPEALKSNDTAIVPPAFPRLRAETRSAPIFGAHACEIAGLEDGIQPEARTRFSHGGLPIHPVDPPHANALLPDTQPPRNPMRSLIFALTAALTIATANAEWMTDAAKAQEQARAEKKLVVMNFTGSDWCPWCFRLRDEVFNTPAFQEYAKNNLVLVEVDFPRRKAISDAQKKANQALAGKYGIEGYPTVVVLDSEGKQVGELGYQEGGPKPFIEKLEQLKVR
jgi:protein disulfide-isomerase